MCPDIDTDIAHTFVHYLHTGHYQTLKSHLVLPSKRTLIEHHRALHAYLAAKEYSLPGLESLARQQVEALNATLPVSDALANVALAFERLGDDDEWLAGYLHRLLVKVVSYQAPDSSLSSETVGQIKSAFSRAMLKGVIRILNDWVAPSGRGEGLRDDVNYEMPLAPGCEDRVTVSRPSSPSKETSHEQPHCPFRNCNVVSNFEEFSECGKESPLPCAEVAYEDKPQEALFDDPEPSWSPCEEEAAKEYLEDAAEECTKEAAKDDMRMWPAKELCEAVAYEGKADTPVEEKADMPLEGCEEPKPADDTTFPAEDQHVMLKPVTEEPAIEPAYAESMTEKEPDEIPPDLESSPCTAPDADALCEAPCKEVSEGPVIAVDSDDGMCDKMSEHLRGPNWRSCKRCSILIGLAARIARQAATEDGGFEFVEAGAIISCL